jgi:hypothetical protein
MSAHRGGVEAWAIHLTRAMASRKLIVSDGRLE